MNFAKFLRTTLLKNKRTAASGMFMYRILDAYFYLVVVLKFSGPNVVLSILNIITFLPILTLIWVGFLGVRFEEGGGGELPPPPCCVKLVRIMLETSNLAHTYSPICSFRKYILYCLGPLYFANLNSAFFFAKKRVFCPKR